MKKIDNYNGKEIITKHIFHSTIAIRSKMGSLLVQPYASVLEKASVVTYHHRVSCQEQPLAIMDFHLSLSFEAFLSVLLFIALFVAQVFKVPLNSIRWRPQLSLP